MATVSELLQSCLARLTSIASSSSLSAHAAQVDPQEWKDELGRLGVWAANIGAHQTGQSSVECRLRDASHTKDQVTRLLEQVQKLLTDLRVILEEEVVEENGRDKSPNDGSEYLEGISRSEIRKIHHGLVATVTQLHQIPIIIHQPAQHDRLMGMDKLDGNQFKNLAEQHLSAEKPAYWKEQERKLEEVQMAHEAEEKKKKELDMKTALEEWKLEQRHLTQKQKEEAKKKDEGFRQRLRLEFGYSEEEIEVIEGMLDKEEEEHNEEGTTEEAPTLTWIKVPRQHLFPETLLSYGLPWELDEDDTGYIVIKQWISWKFQDELFAHSRGLREGKLLAQAEPEVNGHSKDTESSSGRVRKIWSNLRKHYAGSE